METSLNLNKAMLGEIIERIERGEIGYCKQLGFSEDELAAIENLSQRELNHLGKSTVSFVKAEINHHTFWNLIHNVREDTQQRQIIDKALMLLPNYCVKCSAYLRQMCLRRKLLGIKEAMGRKPNADEQEENKVWLMWEQYGIDLEKEEKSMSQYISERAFEVLMMIAEESGVSLTEVVRLVRTGEKQRN